MKAAETFWVDQNAQTNNQASTVAFGNWFYKAKQTLRHFFLQSVLKRIVIPNNSSSRIWESFFLYQQQKADVTEQSIKEEFFYGTHYIHRKSISHRIWKRHSAFLVYHQKINNLRRDSVLKTAHQLESISNELTVADTRISFQVKSFKQLPIWATALNDISLIENDMSSLRFMKVRSRLKITAQAA